MAKHLSFRLSQRKAFKGKYDLACSKNAVSRDNIATTIEEITCTKCKEGASKTRLYYHKKCGTWCVSLGSNKTGIICDNCWQHNKFRREEIQNKVNKLFQSCVFCGNTECEQNSLYRYKTCSKCDAVLIDWLLERSLSIPLIEEARNELKKIEDEDIAILLSGK
jgi:hypothetical protein